MDVEGSPGAVHGPYLKRPAGERSVERFAYEVQGKDRSVEKAWDALCVSPQGSMRRCFDHLATTPCAYPLDPGRGGQLHGRLSRFFQYGAKRDSQGYGLAETAGAPP